ncbi:MAG: pyridoxal phosphate-dependent aminotransferase [Lewinellaceae bacterium]|nr:pyridoxal phosphate-dependent aminotransferase [Lewinellaceae bacterium]MCB9288494.1 pyridoxal phosphate-dependent aminotransferase [Lewinellaceae bacterium]
MATASIQHLSQRIRQMEESATIKMAQMARDLAAQGHDVISLSLGEPDFDTPAHIKEAAKKALDEGYTKYTPVPGLVELRKAIQAKFSRDNGLEYGLNQIVVSNGAKQSIANICLSLLDEGDEVIILAPYWVSYSEIVKLAGGVPVLVSADIEKDYKASAEQIAAAITSRTRVLLFSSPCNPTGSVYLKEELKAIAEVIARHEGIYIISDEIYEYINFTGKHASIGAFEEVKDRTVTVNGFSKGFAMTGWRLGYIGAPEWIAEACSKIQGQFTSGATSFGQKAAAYALLADMTPTFEMREAFRQRRDMVIELLGKIPGMKVNRPQGAFYIFPDISSYFGKHADGITINTADDFCEYLLHNAHVAVVTGSAFGADNCFRISYAASEKELREAIRRIGEAVSKLQ